MADDLEGLQVEFDDDVGLAGGDVSFAGFLNQRDAVHAGSLGNLADRFSSLRVEDIHLGGVRHEQPRAHGVVGDVVPSALAGHGNLTGYLVTGLSLEPL